MEPRQPRKTNVDEVEKPLGEIRIPRYMIHDTSNRCPEVEGPSPQMRRYRQRGRRPCRCCCSGSSSGEKPPLGLPMVRPTPRCWLDEAQRPPRRLRPLVLGLLRWWCVRLTVGSGGSFRGRRRRRRRRRNSSAIRSVVAITSTGFTACDAPPLSLPSPLPAAAAAVAPWVALGAVATLREPAEALTRDHPRRHGSPVAVETSRSAAQSRSSAARATESAATTKASSSSSFSSPS